MTKTILTVYSLGAADVLTDVLDTTDRMEEIAYARKAGLLK